MMYYKLKVNCSVPVGDWSADEGFITKFTAEIVAQDYEDGEELEDRMVGKVLFSLIHAGEALNVGESIYDCLDADSGDLEYLHAIYFDYEEKRLRDDYVEGGCDVLYFDSIEVPDEIAREHKAHVAAARYIIKVFGGSCGIAAIFPIGDTEKEVCELLKFAESAVSKGVNVSNKKPSTWHHAILCSVELPEVEQLQDAGSFVVVPYESR